MILQVQDFLQENIWFLLLSNEIASKLDEREKRDWDLAYEKYNRNQVMSENSANQDIEDRKRANDFRDKNEVELTKMKLDAAKDIARSLSKKKPNTTNLIFRK